MGGSTVLAFFISSCLLVGYASACSQGERTAVDGACDEYMECNEKGELVQKTCTYMKRFDVEKKECDWRWKVKCYQKPSECVSGRVYPHPDSCRLYYSCNEGVLAIQFCPLAKVFDPAKGQCRYGWSCDKVACAASESRVVPADCSSYDLCENGAWVRHACDPNSHYDPSTRACVKGDCLQCAEGDLRAAKACNRYEQCSLGVWQEKKCFWAKRFDPAKKSCVWLFQYTCPKSVGLMNLAETCPNGDARAEEDCTKYSVCQEGTWTIQSCPKDYKFDSVDKECVAGNNARCMSCSGNVADDTSCGSYYTCVEGKKVSKSCGFLKKWDGVSKKCVYWGAHCFPGDACTEEGKKLPTEDCKQYKECISGSYYRTSCGLSRIFDSEKNRCVWVWPWKKCERNQLLAECSGEETRLLSCDHYVKCVQGRWVQGQCKPGETFANGKCIEGECTVQKKSCRQYSMNGVDLECVQGEVFDEQSRECRSGSCAKAKRSVASCVEGEKKAVDCKKYKECVGGSFVEKSCSECSNFDAKDGVCSFMWDHPCDGPHPPAPTTEAECKEGERHPDSGDCRKFTECKKGKLVADSCMWPRQFDSVTLKCVWWGAKCAKQ